MARPGPAGGFGADFASTFSDIFDDLFGMGGGRRGRGAGRERGADLRYNMEISLEEAFAGKTAQVRIPTSVDLRGLLGHRRQGRHASRRPVRTCGGPGRIRHAQGFFTLERTCPSCQGRGQVIDDPVPVLLRLRPRHARAHAVGQHSGRRRGRHPHPARRRGRGRRARRPGRRPLHFPLARPHPFFQRDGADLHCRVPISMVTAALGGEFEVPTIDGGKTRVKVPEGTQSGRRFRLQGKGMPVLRSKQTGDMYVQVVVETPQKLTKRQRELLDEFERLSSKDTHPESAGFFGKVKEFLGRAGSA